jgi:hypothetical protein
VRCEPRTVLPIRSARTGLFPNLTVAPKGKPTTSGLIGQIKLTRNHVQVFSLPGVRVKRENSASLYDVERSGSSTSQRRYAAKLALSCDVMCIRSVLPLRSKRDRQKTGGAGRDRTDDLKLAKLPLSQLSYGPIWDWTAPLPQSSKAGGPG